MTSSALLLLAMMAAAGGLRVETSTPDALCPDVGQVREAAQARLGDIEAQGDWRASYGLVHRPDGDQAGDFVRLELHDATGRLRLRRELPRAGGSCASLARAIVVVLDSYFRHPTEEPEDRAVAKVVLPPPGSARPPGPSPRLALDVAGGWGGAWGDGARGHPLLALGVRAALTPTPWWLGVEGTALLTPDRQTFGTASATQRSYGLRGFLARDLFATGRGAGLLVGPELLLALDRADGAMLPAGVSRTRAAFGAGLRAQLQLRLAARLRLSMSVALDYAPAAWSGTFVLADTSAQTEIFPPAPVRLVAAGGLSWAVF